MNFADDSLVLGTVAGTSALITRTASLLKSRSKERITTFLSDFVVSAVLSFECCISSLGICARASLRILSSIAASSPVFHLNSKERISVGSVSDTATKVFVVPGGTTGPLGAGAPPSDADAEAGFDCDD